MNVISAGLAAHYELGTTTLATCWKVTLTNGTVYGFTSIDRDITFESLVYESPSGVTPSAIANSADLAVDNLEVIGFLDSVSITESDLLAGLWDFAAVEIFEVNYADLTMGKRKVRKGTLGEVTCGRQQFIAELRGLAQQLQQVIGEVYSPSCRADLFDSRCGLNVASYTVTGTLTAVSSNRQFTDTARVEADDYFERGKITFTSGENIGLAREIKSFAAGVIELYLPMPFEVVVGDTYSMYPGCKKRFTEDCQTKYNNVVNFRGEPHVPGNDALSKVGGA